MRFNFSGYFEFFEMIAKNENFQKIGKVVVLRGQKITRPPFRPRKNNSQIKGLLYSKEPALQHRSNEAIDKLIRGRGAEISFEKFQILTVLFGKAIYFFGRAGPPLSLFSENFRFLQSSRKTKSNQKKLVTMINIISTAIRVGLLTHYLK